ncbi:Membrane insertase YidC/ALB3/OXA1/COX18 [Arabidopsis suecica]|uniref:Membrane insertase YidC/ALB3/OXA1/COX18 n=1 Tax=Arabidopsis suecica TaxID=45249 RepID=A0A8T1ZWA1_ARASU|nr:Membrane insertase YidC/ALB3/OXA1/COX18 [Arabidopsis suecica]
MALRRTLSLRSLFSARCYQPSCSGIILRDNVHEEKPNYGSLLHQRSFSSSILSQHLRSSSSHLSLCTPFGVSIYHRSMSTSHVPGSDDSCNVSEVAGTPIDSVMENVASQDWSYSCNFDIVKALIETLHSYTGLNWWASIVLATLLIRGVTIPLMIDNERWRSRIMMLGIHSTASMETKDPAALAEHRIEFDKLLKKYGGTFSLSPFLYMLQFPASVCMGLKISNMTEEVASFKTGGVLWFTDLTTHDTSLIFPLLTWLTFWIMIECDATVGLEGAMIPKKLTRIMVIPMFVVAIMVSKGVHCYLMSCMMFSIAYMLVIRHPGVMKHYGIPEVPEYVMTMLFKRIWGKWL